MLLTEPQKKIRDIVIKQNCTKSNSGALLWHYMGTGKTLTAIIICENMRNHVIIACPSYLKFVWAHEIKKWNGTPTKYTIVSHEGFEDYAAADLKNKIVVLDEMHKVLKNPKILLAFSRASYRIGLSGTPIESIQDLNIVMSSIRNTQQINPTEFSSRFVHVNKFVILFDSALRVLSSFNLGLGPVLINFFNSWIFYFAQSPLFLMTYIFKLLNFKQYRAKWKTSEIAKEFSDSISFVGELNTDPTRHLPELRISETKVKFDDDIIDLSSRWCRGKLTKYEADTLGVTNEDLFAFTDPRVLMDPNIIMQNGRSMGMYHKKCPTKSPKGKVLLDMIKTIKKRFESVMIFSTIQGKCGADGIHKLLRAASIKFVVVDKRRSDAHNARAIKQFNKASLVHPGGAVMVCYEIAEGFSLKNCNNIILAEPIFDSVSMFKQVCGRARRIDVEMPTEKRYVQVITLIGGAEHPSKTKAAMLQMIDFVEISTATLTLSTDFGYAVHLKQRKDYMDQLRAAKKNKSINENQFKKYSAQDFKKEDFEKEQLASRGIISYAQKLGPKEFIIDGPEKAVEIFFAEEEANRKKRIAEQQQQQLVVFLDHKKDDNFTKQFLSKKILQWGFPNDRIQAWNEETSRAVVTMLIKTEKYAGMLGTFRTQFFAILRFIIAPKYQMRALRRFMGSLWNASEDEKSKFSYGETPENDLSPDEICYQKMIADFWAIQELEKEIAKTNLQTTDAVPWVKGCKQCKLWPEEPRNLAKSCNTK